MALLLQNQAMFLGELGRMGERFAKIDERFAKIDERFAKIDERFAHLETELAAIKSILIRHEQMLEALPEAVRQKIGFKRP